MIKRKGLPPVNLWRLADVDRLFERLYALSPTVAGGAVRYWVPNVDVFETKNDVVVKMDLAGVSRDAIKIVLEEGQLVITGVREEPDEEEKEYFHQIEIEYGYFKRVIELPCAVASDRCRAFYRDGFLYVILPKAERQFVVHTTVEIL